MENGCTDHEKKAPYEVTQPMPAPPSEDTVVIRDYDPKKCLFLFLELFMFDSVFDFNLMKLLLVTTVNFRNLLEYVA